MQNDIKLENISHLITSPSSYQCRKTTVNMKVSGMRNFHSGRESEQSMFCVFIRPH